ncbi:MAG: ATP-binding cassette domain-containing protein, partial [Phycisphaerae bacterium]|nr:ATP-binding cassette domain-containing protein [Phycisphaerae bacterium]NIX31904.1 ATP-binding cassette domain-containing protein [Phycisphaerae bacterium]
MSTVVLQNLRKQFGRTVAVDDISLEVAPGEIFGLLGPNGAGKTTTIRLMLDIIRPDNGRVSVFDGPMNEEKKNRIGYLPEERGLYADVKLIEAIRYLASLKGMSRSAIDERSQTYLEKLDLWQHKDKKLSELSRGMHQKAQFIVTVLHDPDLIIVDEPFSGLDPVNTELIRGMLIQMREEGKTIIMSTHQMHQVEMMCDRIALINKGNVVLNGRVQEVRRSFAGNTVEVSGTGPIDALPGVAHAEISNGAHHLTLSEETTPQEFLRTLARP